MAIEVSAARCLQKVSENPYFYHTSFPPLFSHPQSASLIASRCLQKVSENPYFYHTSFPPLFSHHRITAMLTSWSVLRTARPPSPAVGPRLARSRRSYAMLAGYHPSRRPVGKAYDWPHQRVLWRQRDLEWMSGFGDARREPQDRARPAGWQSCLGRLPSPPQNDKIGFPGDGYKFEVPQPLRRPTPTRRAPPAPASSIDG